MYTHPPGYARAGTRQGAEAKRAECPANRVPRGKAIEHKPGHGVRARDRSEYEPQYRERQAHDVDYNVRAERHSPPFCARGKNVRVKIESTRGAAHLATTWHPAKSAKAQGKKTSRLKSGGQDTWLRGPLSGYSFWIVACESATSKASRTALRAHHRAHSRCSCEPPVDFLCNLVFCTPFDLTPRAFVNCSLPLQVTSTPQCDG